MPFYRVNGLMVHLNLGGKLRKKPPAPCCAPIVLDGQRVRCMGVSGYLCDQDVGYGHTCNAPLCEQHATQVGKDLHLCPAHAAERAEQTPELF